MKRFKWYRKWRGGIWYRNRYIFDMGRSVIFCYERQEKNLGWSGHTVSKEDYYE